MKFVSSRDFRLKPGEIWELLEAGEDVVVTSHGKPLGVLIGANEDNMQMLLQELTRLKAKLAVTNMRMQAQSTGIDKLNNKDIDKLIGETRKGR